MEPQRKVRAIIWDLDGVLIRPEVLRHAPDPRLDANLVEFVRAMSDQVQTALLVRAWSEVWQMLIYRQEIEGAFHQILLPPPGAPREANPRLFADLSSELGLEPDETVLVDDSAPAVTAAQAAGLHAIHFQDPAQTGSELLNLLGETLSA